MSRKALVIDISAIIAEIKGEPGAEVVGQILTLPPEGGFFMHAVNVCEVAYHLIKFGFIEKVLLKYGSSRQTRKKRRQACFLTGGFGRKTRREPILTKYGATRRILATLSESIAYELATPGGVTIIEDIRPALWKSAARFKARYKNLALGDCIAIALAESLDADILTGDRDFQEVDTPVGIKVFR